MKHQTFFKVVLCCSLMAIAVLSAQVQGQPPQSRGRGLYGDWKLKVDYGGRQFDSILSFSRDREGNRTAQWISFMGLYEVKDLSYEDGELSFATERPNREGQNSASPRSVPIAKVKSERRSSSERSRRESSPGLCRVKEGKIRWRVRECREYPGPSGAGR